MSPNSLLTHDDVRAIAELAKLDLSQAEVEKYTEQLSSILDYFTLLQEVDTSHIEAITSVLSITNVLREDQAQPALDPQVAVSNSPTATDNQFVVSAVLGDE
ncbi:Asp-tRNA(Asn)/Glu-tRNA(Gln) amidotransferase subunit GatC [Anaerolineales bacterium]